MKEITKQLLTLIHITSNKCLKKIVESNGFKPSIHDEKNNKIEWLGDGVYFWNINDPYAIKLGKNLVKGKNCFCKPVGIIVNLNIDKDRIMDLDNLYWNQQYIAFLKRAYPKFYYKILDYRQIIQEQAKAPTHELNELGKLTGVTINNFLKYLANQKDKEFDIVLGYFYHENVKDKSLILGRDKKVIAQYCIKKVDIINLSMEDWLIKHNI